MKTTSIWEKTVVSLAGAGALFICIQASAFADERSISINGVRMSQEEIVQLDKLRGTQVQSGDYWWDPATGRWSRIANAVMPKGKTPATREVIVNGKRLSVQEIRDIETSTGLTVASGNYWLDEASGLWGRVGSPPQGRISGAGQANIQNSPGGGTTEFHGDGSWSHRNPNTGTGMIYNPNAGGNWRDKVWVSPR